MTVLLALIVRFAWFYTAMGLLVSLVFWSRLLKAKNRARFTDEAIHDGLVKGESDPVFLQLVEIFGNRLGVVILIFIAWPVPLYLMIFPRKKA